MSSIIFIAIYILGTFFSFFFWKKSQDKDYLWLSLLGLALIIFNSADYVLLNVLKINFEPYSSVASIVFSVVIIVSMLIILFKSPSRSKNIKNEKP